jgi:hypothetical protein
MGSVGQMFENLNTAAVPCDADLKVTYTTQCGRDMESSIIYGGQVEVAYYCGH